MASHTSDPVTAGGAAAQARVRVLIVDDSPLVARRLQRELESQPGIAVVGVAQDAFAARDMIAELDPGVMVLDLELPKMDGLTFLRKVMKHHPMPVIIVSGITPQGCELALACLEAGAVAVLCKPRDEKSLRELAQELGELVRESVRVRIPANAMISTAFHPLRSRAALGSTQGKVVAIGASTGGTEALKTVLSALPSESPAIVVVQHMPEGFTRSFAERLNSLCQMQVREASDGEPLQSGVVLLAPGDRHLRIERAAQGLRARVSAGPRVKRHRPSVEVLFDSVAACTGKEALGILLTGMGDDGADGLGSMRAKGSWTIAQDEATSTVFGMPARAIERGHAAEVLALGRIPHAIVEWAQGKRARPAREAS